MERRNFLLVHASTDGRSMPVSGWWVAISATISHWPCVRGGVVEALWPITARRALT
jgi:hypothetical protein